MDKHRLWLWLILLTAVFLRLYNLADAPPGLTHDEADHGISAWQVVQGERPLYFTIGYGREPLYDYATAGLMALLGPTYLAGRLTAVFASLLLIPIMYQWVRRAFDPTTALFTAAGLALSFWPQMTGRQMLRSTLLPTLFAFAVFFFWQGLKSRGAGEQGSRGDFHLRPSAPLLPFLLSALCLSATFYIYLPARVLWLAFPALMGFALLWQRPLFRRGWRGLLITLIMAGAVVWPLLNYLRTHPNIEVRVDELSVPLTAVLRGDFQPLLQNTLASLRLFTSEGDHTWRYNIAGRPFFNPIMGIFFYFGLLFALWQIIRHRHPAHFFALTWLLLGLSPVFVTGPELATTQAIGAQPILYLFPSLALSKLRSWRLETSQRSPLLPRSPAPLLLLALYLFTAITTFRDYFIIWANEPAVRVQYESTMMAAMRYLNEFGDGATAVSTITPAAEHTPALAQMVLHNDNVSLRWFDGRASLLWPSVPNSTLIIPGFTSIPPALQDYLADTAVLAQTLALRPTDEDRPLTIYHIPNPETIREHFTLIPPVQAGDAAQLLGYDLQTATVKPGDVVQVVTLWQVQRPLPDAILFTHLLGPDGPPIAQADRLDVPGYNWQADDTFVQLHVFVVGEKTAVGIYPLTTGLYLRPTGQRLPLSQNNTPLGDSFQLTTLTVQN